MIGAILGDFMPYIIAALIGAGALIGTWVSGSKSGADKVKRKAAEKRADDLQTAKETRDEVDSSSDDDVRDQLHKWNRD